MSGENRQYTAHTELLSFSDRLLLQSRPEVSAQCGDRHTFRRFGKLKVAEKDLLRFKTD